jgi:hypothetical protein
MKAPDLRRWLGANRSDSQRYREDEQQRQRGKDKLSCSDNCEEDHQILLEQAAAGQVQGDGEGYAGRQQ